MIRAVLASSVKCLTQQYGSTLHLGKVRSSCGAASSLCLRIKGKSESVGAEIMVASSCASVYFPPPSEVMAAER